MGLRVFLWMRWSSGCKGKSLRESQEALWSQSHIENVERVLRGVAENRKHTHECITNFSSLKISTFNFHPESICFSCFWFPFLWIWNTILRDRLTKIFWENKPNTERGQPTICTAPSITPSLQVQKPTHRTNNKYLSKKGKKECFSVEIKLSSLWSVFDWFAALNGHFCLPWWILYLCNFSWCFVVS